MSVRLAWGYRLSVRSLVPKLTKLTLGMISPQFSHASLVSIITPISKSLASAGSPSLSRASATSPRAASTSAPGLTIGNITRKFLFLECCQIRIKTLSCWMAAALPTGCSRHHLYEEYATKANAAGFLSSTKSMMRKVTSRAPASSRIRSNRECTIPREGGRIS